MTDDPPRDPNLERALGLEPEPPSPPRPRRRGPIAEAIMRHREALRERAEAESPDLFWDEDDADPGPPERPREPEVRETEEPPGRHRPPRTPLSDRIPDPPIKPLAALAVLIVVLLAAVGTWILIRSPGSGPGPGSGEPAGGAGDQHVVGWFVSDQRTEEAFVGVVATGGGRSSVALAIPSYTVTNIPGYGTASLGDALSSPDPDVAASAVENILGVRLDAWRVSALADLAPVADGLGGVEVSDEHLDGRGVVRALRRGGDEPVAAEFRFLRWQEVLAGLLGSADGRVDVLRPVGLDVARILVAAGSDGAQVLELPVRDIGSGLARPEAKATDELVAEWFVPTARTTKDVRLVVLNGVGTPGVAQRVARVLVPSGFELVSSLNADSFDMKETQIVASKDRFLQEAELARELLGTGRVVVGRQPTGLADVTVIVGADFGGR